MMIQPAVSECPQRRRRHGARRTGALQSSRGSCCYGCCAEMGSTRCGVPSGNHSLKERITKRRFSHPADDKVRSLAREMEWCVMAGEHMAQTPRFQETLRKLAMIEESFIEDEAGLGFDLAATSTLDPKTAMLLRVGACVAIASPGVCLQWAVGRAMAAGASEDEIADVLLAITPVAGLGRIVSAAPDVAIALGYDVAVALGEVDDH